MLSIPDFEGALTLPAAAVSALGLPYLIDIAANLADDSSSQVAVHQATILWDGREVDVAVLAMGKRPLLGTALLDGYNLNADFEDNGTVAVTRLEFLLLPLLIGRRFTDHGRPNPQPQTSPRSCTASIGRCSSFDGTAAPSIPLLPIRLPNTVPAAASTE